MVWSKAPLSKSPLSIGLTFAVALGLLVLGYLSLSRGMPGAGLPLKAIPFGPEPGTRIQHGMDFDLSEVVKSTSPSARIRWEDVAKQLSEAPSEKRTRKLEEALQALAPDAAEFTPYEYGMAFSVVDSILQGLRKPGSQDEKRLTDLSKDKHPFGRYAYGRLALALGQTETARASFKKATDAAPDFAFAWSQLGYLNLADGNVKAAKPCFRRAIGLIESDSTLYQRHRDYSGLVLRNLPMVEGPPYGGLAQVYLAEMHPDTAAQIMGYAEDRGWRDGHLVLAQAWWWEFKGQMTKARGIYDSLQLAYPAWDALHKLRSTLGLKGSSELDGRQALFAIRTLDPLLKAYPKNAPLRLAMAQAYIQRGLHGLAVAQLDSGLALDPSLIGADELRRDTYAQWIRNEGESVAAKPKATESNGLALEGEDRVIIPSALALLGTYGVAWGASTYRMREAYPNKAFQVSKQGNLVDRFVYDGLVYENVAAYKTDSLWGILAMVTDTTENHVDVFGRMIRMKTKISGEGRGTGEASCPGYRTFQGAIWENDDTFEFMAQFQGKENQVRLARIARSAMPYDRRLCDMVSYLDRDFWEDPQPSAKKKRQPEKALRQAGETRKRPDISPMPATERGTGVPIITPASPEFDASELGKNDPNDLSTLSGAE